MSVHFKPVEQFFSFIGQEVNNAFNAAQESFPTVVKNIKSVAKLVSGETGTALAIGSNIVKGLQGFGAIAQDNAFTKNLLSVAALVHSTFQLVPTVFSVEEITTVRNEMLANIASSEPTDLREKRVEQLKASCDYVMKNEKRLRKSLDLAKETRIHLVSQRVLEGLKSDSEEVRNKALEEGEKLMQTLRRRVNTKFGIELTKLNVRTAGVAISIASFFTGPSPTALIAFGAFGVATLALYVFEKVMLPKDPFSVPKDVWHEKAPHNFREGFFNGYRAVQDAMRQTAKVVHNFPSFVTVSV